MVFLFECSEVLLPSGFHNLSAGLEQRKKTKHLFERAETCNTFLRVGGLIPWLRSFSPFASAPSMAFRKLFFMAHGHPADYVGGAFFGSIGLVFLLGLLCAHYIFSRARKACKGFVSGS